MHNWNIKSGKKTRLSKTLKCSRSKTIRPIKLKRSPHVDLLRSTWCELFSFLCLIVLDLEHAKKLKAEKFQSCWSYEINMMWTFQLFMPNCFGFRAFIILGGLVFCLFTLYSHFMVCFIFLCPYYTDPFKIPSMNVTWEFYQNSRQTKKFKISMKSFNNFLKQSMLTTLSDGLLTLLTFRMDNTLSK